MPCFTPLQACLVKRSDGKSAVVFDRAAGGKGVSLPCGRCMGCRLEKARQWAVRLMHESKMHDESIFLTLTYSDKFLPKNGSLSLEHVQLFMKRLRERIAPVRIRFYLCGEYGEKLSRPHYHALIFGYAFPDRKPLALLDDSKHPQWWSPLIDDVWGMGRASFGDVTFESAAYCSSYALKKVDAKKSYVDSRGNICSSAEEHYRGRRPEFQVMSRRPGIGASWIDRYVSDVYPSDEVIVNGRQARPPRFYDKFFEAKSPEEFGWIRDKREVLASELEDLVLKSGKVVPITASLNARRKASAELIARAKLSLKSRRMESVS